MLRGPFYQSFFQVVLYVLYMKVLGPVFLDAFSFIVSAVDFSKIMKLNTYISILNKY